MDSGDSLRKWTNAGRVSGHVVYAWKTKARDRDPPRFLSFFFFPTVYLLCVVDQHQAISSLSWPRARSWF